MSGGEFLCRTFDIGTDVLQLLVGLLLQFDLTEIDGMVRVRGDSRVGVLLPGVGLGSLDAELVAFVVQYAREIALAAVGIEHLLQGLCRFWAQVLHLFVVHVRTLGSCTELLDYIHFFHFHQCLTGGLLFCCHNCFLFCALGFVFCPQAG